MSSNVTASGQTAESRRSSLLYPGQAEGLPPPFKDPYCPYPDPALRADDLRRKVDENAQHAWNNFYLRHEGKFFKDRHWFLREFPELLPHETRNENINIQLSEIRSVLEVGCGVGNTTLPLLPLCRQLTFCSFDLSSAAIQTMKNDARYDAERMNSFVLDIVTESLPAELSRNSFDAVLLIFVLSAIAPQHHFSVINKLSEALRTGGIVMFRDYGHGDLAAERFAKKGDQGTSKSQTLTDRWFMRQDGTQAYFFEIDELVALFDKCGFDSVHCEYHAKEVINEKRKLTMERKWIQAKFMRR